MKCRKNFIDEINNLSNSSIDGYKSKIDTLQEEVNTEMGKGEKLTSLLEVKQNEMKEFEDVPKKLNQYGNIKGKLSEKISSIVKEHKFFEEHSVFLPVIRILKKTFV